jgi:pentatricopeptide repeat protein
MKYSSRLDWSRCRAVLAGGQSLRLPSSRPAHDGPRLRTSWRSSREQDVSEQMRSFSGSLAHYTRKRRPHLQSSALEGPSSAFESEGSTRSNIQAGDRDRYVGRTLIAQKLRRQLKTQQELLELVGPDDGESVEAHLEFYKDPYRRGYAQPDGPQLAVSESSAEWHYPGAKEVAVPNDYEERILLHLRTLLYDRIARRDAATLQEIYQTYRRLPEPRMQYLTGSTRHRLLHALGFPEGKDVQSMFRHFAVIAEVKSFGLKLTRGEWNAAIAHASRYVARSSHEEVEQALVLWKEMEQLSGIVGSDVTFNILFDVASKAGNFTLAEMLYNEMEARGHAFNRYHHVSLIHFFGLKHDTVAVRAAYREMVCQGHIVDTVVINCVLAGFIRSGEEFEADELYEKMKSRRGQALRPPAAKESLLVKAVTQAFDMFAKVSKSNPSMRSVFQNLASIEPNLQTYRILLNHYGAKVGNIVKVAHLLDDMKAFNIPLHGAVFLALFKSFATHGGHITSPWNIQRLESVWVALLQALDNGHKGLTVSTWLALWALRAFVRCSSKAHVVQVYEELSKRWDLDTSNKRFMAEALHKLLNPTHTSPIKQNRMRKSWDENGGAM